MKYEQDRDSSGEILRLIIRRMAEHPAAFTPPNYAVWYEFVTGINPALSDAMGKQLDSDERLGDDDIDKLYARYVSECNSDVQRMLREDVQQLLGKLADFTEETHQQAHDFGSSLETYSKKLKQNLDQGGLGKLIDGMSDDTGKMRNSVQALRAELAASQEQVKKLHKELESARSEALIDPLTGILNRRGFELKLNKAYADPAMLEKGLCVLMLDIDHFKKINDTYGHLFGDKVIRAVAATLKSKVRGQDAVARLGGEEFAVLLEETDAKGGFIVGEHIRQSIERGKIRRLDTQEQIGGTTLSVGVAVHAPGVNAAQLLDQADKALYASKKGGRNRTTIHGRNQPD